MEFYDVLFNKKYGRKRGGYYAQLFADVKQSIYKTVNGATISVTDAAGGKPKNLILKINPIQSGSGTPSIKNKRPISGVMGAELSVNNQDYNITWQEKGVVYGGTFNFNTGALTADKIILDAQTIVELADAHNFIGSKLRADISIEEYLGYNCSVTATPNPTECICNIAPTNFSWDTFSRLADYEAGAFVYKHFNWSATRFYISIPDESITTLEQAWTWTYNNDFKICYKLANPKTYQLTPVDVTLLNGVNNLSVDTGEITLTYQVKGGN